MSTLLKVFLGIAIVVAGTIVMLVAAGFFFARNVHVRESGSGDKKTVNIETPFGHVTVHKDDQLDPTQLGIPIYPGASKGSDRGGADFEIDSGTLHKDVTAAGATYFTSDSPEKVRDFYREKFPSWNSKWNNDEFEIEAKGDGRLRSIGVKREGDRTRIAVASVGPPAAN